MGKLEYLDALKRAMTGLPPEAQAKTLAYYEQRFVDGVAAGRTEQDIASELDDPKKIAMTLRANAHMQAFDTKKNPANLVRMVVAFLGLAIFNLFMVVPAMVYAALLAALYACGLAFYLAGAVITASGLSGANEIKLDGPLRNVFLAGDALDNHDDLQTKVSITEEGIRIFSEPGPEGKTAARANARAADAAARVAEQAARAAEQAGKAAEEAGQAMEEAAGAAQAAATAAASAAAQAVAAMDDDDGDDKRSVRVIKRAESVASKGILVSTDTDDDSRATQTLFGFCMLLGGIILLLLSLVVTRYTFIGLKRYIDMNFSLLRGI